MESRRRVRALARPKTSVPFLLAGQGRERDLRVVILGRAASQQESKLEIYQSHMARAFEKQVQRRSFKEGDMVLMIRRPIVVARRSRVKLDPKWDLVKKVFSNGVYQLATGRILPPVNGNFLPYPRRESQSSSKPANRESRKI